MMIMKAIMINEDDHGDDAHDDDDADDDDDNDDDNFIVFLWATT